MRRIVATIAAALAIPVLLAFQITAGPMIFCPTVATFIMIGNKDAAAPGRLCIIKSKAEDNSCCRKAMAGCGEMSGGCKKPVTTVVETCAKRPASHGCASRTADTEQRCPRKWSACCNCLPVTFRVDPVFELTARDFDFNVLGDRVITRSLVQADRQLSLLHTHSPPLESPGMSGFDRCIEKCSFLL